MRILVLSAMLSMLGLQLLDTHPQSAIATDAANRAWHEQARNQLLTAAERLELESRQIALEQRTLANIQRGRALTPE